MNNVKVSGIATDNLVFSHESYNEKFYILNISVNRESNTKDTLPILVSDRIVDTEFEFKEKYLFIEGNIRTYNINGHLTMYIYADSIDSLDLGGLSIDINTLNIDGTICKKSEIRETPLGRKICDVILAVNRNYNKSSYIPCIFWGKNAKYISTIDIGTKVNIKGRLQSRQYTKENETKIAYEVSVQELNI